MTNSLLQPSFARSTDFAEVVVSTIAELTRYPPEILVPAAHLEDDLGIDSVKRAEILTTLGQRMGVPAGDESYVRNAAMPRTVGDLIELAGTVAVSKPVEAPPLVEPSGRQTVIDVVAELTRYPREILVESAHLEDDLGIDSVKRAEILTVLAQRLSIAIPSDRAEWVVPRTIGELVALGERLSGTASAPQPVPPLRPAPVAAPPALRSIPPIPAGPPAAGQKMSFTNPSIALDQPGRSAPATAASDALQSRVLERVTETFAAKTHHPPHLFAWHAELDGDLGIDAATTHAVLAEVGAALGLPSSALANPPALHTVGDVVTFVRGLSPRRAGSRLPIAASAPASPVPAAFLGTGSQARPFEGRVALVTGSGHGLGKVLACQLAELGATVVVNSFYSRVRAEETTAEIVAAGGKAVHIWGSVANPAHLQSLFEEIDRQFGHLDFYIQNASNGVIGPLDQVTAEHWDRAFRTNVSGFHRAAFLAAELMKRRGGGRIIALSSPGAHRYIEHFGCLGPVKAAVESLARYLAVELGPHNIQVNVVSAGPVYGERLTNYPDADRLIPYWETLSPDGRLGEASEITANVLYLLSPAASKINGAVLLVDGAASLRM